MLPIALGEATKTVSYVMDGAKTYRFTVRWGEARDTDDAEGRVTAETPVRPTSDAIRAALPAFTGEIEQAPPAYSAIKIDGERAYKRARAAEDVRPAPRLVRVDSLTLLSAEAPTMRCSRSPAARAPICAPWRATWRGRWARWARFAALRRLRVGHFPRIRRFRWKNWGRTCYSAPPAGPASGRDRAGRHPGAGLTETAGRRPAAGPARCLAVRGPRAARRFCATADGKPVALARIEGGQICPVRVLNL